MLVSVPTHSIIVLIDSATLKTLRIINLRRFRRVESVVQAIRILCRYIKVLVRNSLRSLFVDHRPYSIGMIKNNELLVSASWWFHERAVGLLHLLKFVISVYLLLVLCVLTLVDVDLVRNIEATRGVRMVPLLLYAKLLLLHRMHPGELGLRSRSNQG
jgi:hypothetical protein